MLKGLYIQRIKTLKNDIKNCENFIFSKKSEINEYTKLLDELLKEIKNISDNEKVEPNIKYIQINEKTLLLQKISSKIENLYNEINKNILNINKNKNIFIENCLNDHKNIKKEILLEEIQKKFLEN